MWFYGPVFPLTYVMKVTFYVQQTTASLQWVHMPSLIVEKEQSGWDPPFLQPFIKAKGDHVLQTTKENSRVRTNETANETTRFLREIQGKAPTGDSSLTEAMHHVSQALIT